LFRGVFDSLEESQKHALLHFTTGSKYPSALSFDRHPIIIQKISWEDIPFPSSESYVFPDLGSPRGLQQITNATNPSVLHQTQEGFWAA
jgi:hypothetical protein